MQASGLGWLGAGGWGLGAGAGGWIGWLPSWLLGHVVMCLFAYLVYWLLGWLAGLLVGECPEVVNGYWPLVIWLVDSLAVPGALVQCLGIGPDGEWIIA